MTGVGSTILVNRSTMIGTKYEHKGFIYTNDRVLWKTDMPDYTILTDYDFTPCIPYAPESLKEALCPRWIYNLHIGQSESSKIKYSNLQQRIKGGEILAYRYTECIIEGNEAVYCGFIPTKAPKTEDLIGTHKICRFSLQEVYPRKLYVHLKRMPGRCFCTFENSKDDFDTSTMCFQWKGLMYNGSERIFCSKKIDWCNLYVFMGEADEECKEFTKIPRDCPVCAQCRQCNIGAFYCRKHITCRHKKAKIFIGKNSNLSTILKRNIPKIKPCKIIKK